MDVVSCQAESGTLNHAGGLNAVLIEKLTQRLSWQRGPAVYREVQKYTWADPQADPQADPHMVFWSAMPASVTHPEQLAMQLLRHRI